MLKEERVFTVSKCFWMCPISNYYFFLVSCQILSDFGLFLRPCGKIAFLKRRTSVHGQPHQRGQSHSTQVSKYFSSTYYVHSTVPTELWPNYLSHKCLPLTTREVKRTSKWLSVNARLAASCHLVSKQCVHFQVKYYTCLPSWWH